MAIELIKGLKDFGFEIVKADLKVKIGLQDAALTAISVGIIASILGIILKKHKLRPFITPSLSGPEKYMDNAKAKMQRRIFTRLVDFLFSFSKEFIVIFPFPEHTFY